ncbi:MAG: hypothetical protein A3G91_04805 [Omnitrophica WOR_2 bacterium RIFCSPLOWO2_12_FULL_50_9]|nr:MAG: hypothetical protein A3D87_06070 [Omnitrophica WOR_2 bacterium RIFCSPHIGHO2_02_FULL_50_17]OGX41454.1 MAG: hypothetical protein A3G91_04805 [Omnitrophica WOR_2 bacterium RIFCSPLOWO2_12_FULL_50_9]
MQLISPVQEKILQDFGKVKDSNQFYLTGGTALAYFYLNHRQSNDLDFFTSAEEIIDPFSRQLEKHLAAQGFESQRQRSFHFFVELIVSLKGETTLIHLALDSAFRFEPARIFPGYPDLKVDGLTDIASNKLLALFGRAALRDFIDVYFLLQDRRFSREQLAEAARQKDPGFDLYWLGVAFERIHTFPADSPDMLLLLQPVKFKELENFFDKWRQEIARELKS